jgi:hypothetical protein
MDSGLGGSRSFLVRVFIAAFVVTVLVSWQLFRTASVTDNYEGVWFSLLHTVIVATGVVLALGSGGIREK